MTRHTLARAAMRPDGASVVVADAPIAQPAPDRRAWPAVLLGRALDRLFARWSLVGDEPVLDVRLFPWTADLRADWRTVRDEALAVAPQVGRWRSFALWDGGVPVAANARRCPATAALLARIPAVESAMFSILAPGTHVAERRGSTRALVTCHLGLIVPRDGDATLRLGTRVLRWAEGETLVFDDTCPHVVRNDARESRAVLLIRVARPLRRPGTWLAAAVLRWRRERKGFARAA